MGSIKERADACLNRQLRTILPFIGLLTIALFLSAGIVNPTAEAQEEFGESARLYVAFGRAVAFLLGLVSQDGLGSVGWRVVALLTAFGWSVWRSKSEVTMLDTRSTAAVPEHG